MLDFATFLGFLALRFSFPSPPPALPQHDPKIVGIERNYYEGDFLFGNCTSDYSSPPPNLAWYINGMKAEAHLLQPFQESTIEAYGFKLLQRSLEIRFRVDKNINPFITDSRVHMKCVAQLRHMAAHMRESHQMFFISSLEDQRNQKYYQYKNSGENRQPFCLGKLCKFMQIAEGKIVNYIV